MITRAFRMKLKPGNVKEYQRRHDDLWPDLADALHAAGIYDYSIFLDEETLHLFGVLKLHPNHQIDDLPTHPVMRHWWDYMADLMETQADASPVSVPLTPVFYLA